MILNDMTFKMGGTAGAGLDTVGASFCQMLARSGLHVFGAGDFQSRIRGGHISYHLRVSDSPLWGYEEAVHIVMGFLDDPPERTITEHVSELVPGGAIIYDETLKVAKAEIEQKGIHVLDLPLQEWALELGKDKQRRPVNTGAVAAACALSGLPLEFTENWVKASTGRRRTQSSALTDNNLAVAREAYGHVMKHYSEIVKDFEWKLEPGEKPSRMVIDGNASIVLGAIGGGCKVLTGYPMTPASGILEGFAAKARQLGLVAKQTEDEISGILMAIGAAHAGTRACTATSGGGFALMVEALSLAGSSETPLVVFEVQRPGPATGLPTKSGQEDLLFCMHAGHGEFTRAILAPGTHEQSFQHGTRAFNLAEKYQTPVIVLTDRFLAEQRRDIPESEFDFNNLLIDRGQTYLPDEADTILDKNGDGYKRYDPDVKDGVSPRIVPGHPDAVYPITGEEHLPNGLIDWDEGAENRCIQVEKRMRKTKALADELEPPTLYGPDDAEWTLLCWGSTYGACRETVDILKEQDVSINMMHFHELAPLPTKAYPILEKAKRLISVESNYTGQFARYVRMETGRGTELHIGKWDGRGFTPQYIINKLTKVLECVTT